MPPQRFFAMMILSGVSLTRNTDLLLTSYIQLINLIPKLVNSEKLSNDELKELSSLKEKLKEQIDKHTI